MKPIYYSIYIDIKYKHTNYANKQLNQECAGTAEAADTRSICT